MIVNNTVLILGAGASEPFTFPTGPRLRELVCHALGDESSVLTRRMEECGFRHPDQRQEFRLALLNSRRPSIDAFLEGRPEFQEIGKVAIAASLIPYEHPDSIFNAKRNWYDYVLHRLGSRPDDISKNRLSILTYNYDRSLEYFFFTAFTHSFGLTGAEAAAMVQSIPIMHLHGQLGDLPELTTDGRGRVFSTDFDVNTTIEAARTIKVLTDDFTTDAQFDRARELLRNAQVICFLGFGYHPVNLQRLQFTDMTTAEFYGSAFDITLAERSLIIKSAGAQITFGYEHHDVLAFLRGSTALNR